MTREQLGKIKLRDATLDQLREFLELRERPKSVPEFSNHDDDLYDIRNHQSDVSQKESTDDGTKTA